MSANIAKFEEHKVEGRNRMLCVTGRCDAGVLLAAGGSAALRDIGQRHNPGDMGQQLHPGGTEKALEDTWGAHARSGRVMSRMLQSRDQGQQIQRQMSAWQVCVRRIQKSGRGGVGATRTWTKSSGAWSSPEFRVR